VFDTNMAEGGDARTSVVAVEFEVVPHGGPWVPPHPEERRL